MFTSSGITGFTLPGMMDDPGCSAGRLISARPALGPDVNRIRSLDIFESFTARLLSAEEYATNPCWSQVAAIMSAAGTIGLPVSFARRSAHFFAYPFGTLIPVPIAVAPMLTA